MTGVPGPDRSRAGRRVRALRRRDHRPEHRVRAGYPPGPGLAGEYVGGRGLLSGPVRAHAGRRRDEGCARSRRLPGRHGRASRGGLVPELLGAAAPGGSRSRYSGTPAGTAAGSRPNASATASAPDRLRTPELAEQPGLDVLDGLRRDPEDLGRPPDRVPLGGRPQDVGLPGGQLGQAPRARAPAGPTGRARRRSAAASASSRPRGSPGPPWSARSGNGRRSCRPAPARWPRGPGPRRVPTARAACCAPGWPGRRVPRPGPSQPGSGSTSAATIGPRCQRTQCASATGPGARIQRERAACS